MSEKGPEADGDAHPVLVADEQLVGEQVGVRHVDVNAVLEQLGSADRRQVVVRELVGPLIGTSGGRESQPVDPLKARSQPMRLGPHRLNKLKVAGNVREQALAFGRVEDVRDVLNVDELRLEGVARAMALHERGLDDAAALWQLERIVGRRRPVGTQVAEVVLEHERLRRVGLVPPLELEEVASAERGRGADGRGRGELAGGDERGCGDEGGGEHADEVGYAGR